MLSGIKNAVIKAADDWGITDRLNNIYEAVYYSDYSYRASRYWMSVQYSYLAQREKILGKWEDFKGDAKCWVEGTLEPYVINKMQIIFGNPDFELSKLIFQSTCEGKDVSGVRKNTFYFKRLGVLGNLAVYAPNTEKELKDFFIVADKQKNSRKGYLPFSIFGRGDSLLTSTGHRGMKLHNQVAHYLIPNQQKFIDHAIKLLSEVIKKQESVSKREIVRVVRQTLLSMVLGIDDELNYADMCVIDNAAKVVLTHSGPSAFFYQFHSSLACPQKEFLEFSKKILKAQVKKTTEFFADYPKNANKPNLITDKIIELVKRKNPTLNKDALKIELQKLKHECIQCYMNSFEVSGLLSIIFGAEFLSNLIMHGFNIEENFPAIANELDASIVMNEDGSLDHDKLAARDMPLLDSYFNKMLYRVEGPNLLPRHFDQEVKLESVTIPKNTMVFINLGLIKKSREVDVPFLPFSSGPRQCPGNRFSASVAKALWVYVAMNFTATWNWYGDETYDIKRKIKAN
jgi:hypothetical protein